MTPGMSTIGTPAIRDALALIRRTHGHFRAAENALLGGHADFASLTAHEGFEQAILACEALSGLGDKRNGMAQISRDQMAHAHRPSAALAGLLAAGKAEP